MTPPCPECGAPTRECTSKKTGRPFYGCTRWKETGCKGIVDGGGGYKPQQQRAAVPAPPGDDLLEKLLVACAASATLKYPDEPIRVANIANQAARSTLAQFRGEQAADDHSGNTF